MNPPLVEAQDHRRLPRLSKGHVAIGAAASAMLCLLTGGVAEYEGDQPRQEARNVVLASDPQQQQAGNLRLGALVAGLAGGGIRPDTIAGTSLRKVEGLPGYGQEVNEASKKQLRTASVQLVTRPAGAPANAAWTASCSGTMIRYDGGMGVLTAGHCVTFKRQGAL